MADPGKKSLFELTEGSAPLLTDYALTGEDPAGIHVLRRTTWQSIKNLFMSGVTTQSDNAWIPITDTWTYASATTITVPTGAASLYSVGDKFKLTSNAVVLQGYIVAVADTLLTVLGDALTNHTFSSKYYSHGATPVGFTHWYPFTPIATGGSGSAGTYAMTNKNSRYSIVGRTLNLQIFFQITNVGSWGGAISVSIPVAAANTTSEMPVNGMIYASNTVFPIGSGYKAIPILMGTNLSFWGTVGVGYFSWASIAANDLIVANFSYEI